MASAGTTMCRCKPPRQRDGLTAALPSFERCVAGGTPDLWQYFAHPASNPEGGDSAACRLTGEKHSRSPIGARNILFCAALLPWSEG
jgi:hypothetical protein